MFYRKISCLYVLQENIMSICFTGKYHVYRVFLLLVVSKIWKKTINSHNHIGKKDYQYEIWLCLVDVFLKAFLYKPTMLIHLPIHLLAYLIEWPHIRSICRKHFPVLSPFMPYHQSYTTCVTNGAGTAYHYEHLS
jgi:hypothetical protein